MTPTPHRALLVLPPLTQLNTPYPATAYLTGYLRQLGVTTFQVDLGLELVLALFSRDGMRRLFEAIDAIDHDLDERVDEMRDRREAYLATIEPAVRFLQGRDATLAARIASRRFLPESARFDAVADDLDWAFGALGVQDRARFIATRYLDDIADVVRLSVAPHFAFTRYAERLAASAPSYDPMQQALDAPIGLIDALLLERLEAAVTAFEPTLVGFTVPFPGNLYGALRCGRWLAEHRPGVVRVLGGGYPNTELRALNEPRLFDAVDFVTLDDGERPFAALLEHLEGKRDRDALKRTFFRDGERVRYADGAEERDVPHAALPAPSYAGLLLDRYLSVLELPNPMHRLWSDGRWNKLTLAHGCYWKKCSFCDVTLDYIARYDIAPAEANVDRMESLIRETGESGFHFVDEAAPPTGLRDLAIELLARGTTASWWTNIRFERAFSDDLCRLLAASGCIAVSGGLEVASDRLLALMEKGVTVAQVSRVAAAFTRAGVMVHAYLMYGFPTQTTTETVDALEVVRQLFAEGALQSGYWHRFAMTAHSPVGRNPAKYGVTAVPLADSPFAVNDVEHIDPTDADHEMLGRGLERAIYNYMHGVGTERPAHAWFEARVPRTSVAPGTIAAAIHAPPKPDIERLRARLVWLGGTPDWLLDPVTDAVVGLRVVAPSQTLVLELDAPLARWLAGVLDDARPAARTPRLLGEVLGTLPSGSMLAHALTESWTWVQLRQAGLLLV